MFFKKPSLPLLITSYLLLIYSASSTAGEVGFATGNGMHLRMQRTSSSGIVCTFKAGDKVEILSTSGDWHLAKSIQSETCSTKQGYMHKSIISLIDPNSTAGESEPIEDDLRDEDHAHDHSSELAPQKSSPTVRRETIINSRIEALSNYDFENKSFRYVVTEKIELQSNPMSISNNETLCELKTGSRLNLAGSLTHLHAFVQVEDEGSSCNGTKGYVTLKSIDEQNFRSIKGSNIRLRETPDTSKSDNIKCSLSSPTKVVLVEKHDSTWSKVFVEEEVDGDCSDSMAYIHTSFLTHVQLIDENAVCGDSRIKNIAVPGWGKQKIGVAWVAKWETKFCPALRGMAEEFGEVRIVSGVRPYQENKTRGGAGCSKHRLRWQSNGRHVGCGQGRDLGSLGGALDIILPGVWGNGACNDNAALRSQRKAYSFIRNYRDFRVNVYKSGRIHMGLLSSPGASRVPYSTCVR